MIYTARQIGQMGEIAAARYLRDNGYSIVCANFRAKTGEIDLVASKGNVIAFCEVKTKTAKAYCNGPFVYEKI